MHLRLSSVYLITLLTLLTSASMAQEETAPKEEEKAKAVTLSGTFEGTESTELSAGTEHLKSLVISKIVPHGTVVKKGQVVAAFETKDVDEKIKTAETDLRLAKITQQEEELNYEQFKATQELDRAAAQRAWKLAQQAFDNFQQTDKDRTVASAEFSLKSAEASLANAAEELKQLEQMYKEDELTEESEEIVLKRAKQSVESAEFRLAGTKVQTDRTIKQSVPQQVAQQKDTLNRAELAYTKANQSLQFARSKQEIDINRKREKFRKQEREFKELQAERKRLVITAPHDGIALHGTLTRGKLSDKPSSLKKKSTVTSEQVLVTLVNPARLQIRTELTETLRKQVEVGAVGMAEPNTVEDSELKVRVKSIGSVPFANNKFDCLLTVSGSTDGILPGTGCVVKLAEKK